MAARHTNLFGESESAQFDMNAQEVETSIRNADSYLYLSDADLTAADLDLSGLASLNNLSSLHLDRCKVNDKVFAQIADIPGELRMLSISDCVVCGDLSSISQRYNLHYLMLTGNDLTQEQLASIDFRGLTELTQLDVSNNPQLSDFTLLKACESLSALSVNSCSLTDLTLLPAKELTYLEVSGNGITDLSPLAAYPKLFILEANQNQISDLSVLSGMSALRYLEVNENLLSSLEPLASCPNLEEVSVNGNSLSSLAGLESALALKKVEAAQNSLTDIDGLRNCTRLETVDLGKNGLYDIALLAKSAATLTHVYLNDNHLTSLEALRGAAALKVLNFEENEITSLAPLQGCGALEYLYGGHNQLASTAGLGSAPGLKELFLPYNQISDDTELASLDRQVSTSLDLSHNLLTSLTLVPGKEYWLLAVHDNPLETLPHNEKIGYRIIFSYLEGEDYSAMNNGFSHCMVLDCPEDQQLALEDTLGIFCTFVSSEEADKGAMDERYYNYYGYESDAAED